MEASWDFLQCRDGVLRLLQREVAHPDREELPLLLHLLHRAHRLLYRHLRVREVHLVEVHVRGLQPLEALLEGPDEVVPPQVIGPHLRRDEEVLPLPSLDRPGDQRLGAVELRRVDEVHPPVEPRLQGLDLGPRPPHPPYCLRGRDPLRVVIRPHPHLGDPRPAPQGLEVDLGWGLGGRLDDLP